MGLPHLLPGQTYGASTPASSSREVDIPRFHVLNMLFHLPGEGPGCGLVDHCLPAAWWTIACPRPGGPLPAQPPLPETYLYACLGGFLSRCFYNTVSHLVQPGLTNGVLLSGCQPPKWRPHQGEGVPHPELEGLQGLTPRVTLSSG